LPDFSWYNIPKRGKTYQMTTKLPNAHKIHPIVVIYYKGPECMYNNIFHSKILQNIPELRFLVWIETIWQTCTSAASAAAAGESGWPDLASFHLLGGCLLLAAFWKITEVVHIFQLLFSTVKWYELILTKHGLGYVLGDFFTNSSGHPAGGGNLNKALLSLEDLGDSMF
jgi:hypothetical protein